MKNLSGRPVVAALLAVLALGACSSAQGPLKADTQLPINPITGQPVAPRVGPRQAELPSEADVNFMSGMIPHHAQAVLIAGWAAAHAASPSVKALCERIVVGQRDEIAIMQTWLKDRGQKAPPADATHHVMTMNGMEHKMLMPGMLNEEELDALNKARGNDFDRLFLQAMIKHHLGAITMVDELFSSRGAAGDDIVYKFASDVYADQTTEIERMQKMLDMVPAAGR